MNDQKPDYGITVRLPRGIIEDIRKVKEKEQLPSIGIAIKYWLEQEIEHQKELEFNEIKGSIKKIADELGKMGIQITLIDALAGPACARSHGYQEWIEKGWTVSPELKEHALERIENLKRLKTRLEKMGVQSHSLTDTIEGIERVKELDVDTKEEKPKEKPEKTLEEQAEIRGKKRGSSREHVQ